MSTITDSPKCVDCGEPRGGIIHTPTDGKATHQYRPFETGAVVKVGGHGNDVGRTGTVVGINSSGWVDVGFDGDPVVHAIWPEHLSVVEPDHRDDGQCHPECWERAVAEFEAAQPAGGHGIEDGGPDAPPDLATWYPNETAPSVDKARVEEAQELLAEARSAYAAFVAAWQEVGRLVDTLDRHAWHRVDAYPGWNGTRDAGAGKDMAGWMDEVEELLEDAAHADDDDYVSESEKRAMDGNR